MRAMILAGGMSTRLYPLTKQVPKPIVPVAGEPISGHVMRWLASHGFDEVAINVFYLAEKVESAFGDGREYGVKLHYLREPRIGATLRDRHAGQSDPIPQTAWRAQPRASGGCNSDIPRGKQALIPRSRLPRLEGRWYHPGRSAARL